MKILLLNSERGWRGGEAQTLLLAEGLREKGYVVIIGCPADSALAQRAAEAQVVTFSLSMKGSLALSSVWRLRRWIKEQAPDIIHAQTAHAHSAAALALYGKTTPLVVARRVNFPLSRSGFTRWKYGRAQAIIAISRAVRTTLEQAGIATKKIHIVSDGVVLPSESQPKAEKITSALNVPVGHKLVLCIANLSAEKDHETLLQAWKIVEHYGAQAQLILVGDGERRSILEDLVLSLELKACRFVGFRSDIAALLEAAYVVALSSREEGLGSILLEAQARGVPIVATNAGGIPEAVAHSRTGLVVPVGDVAAFAASLLQLLNDPEQHRRFAQEAKEHIERNFSAANIVDQHMTLYRQLLTHSANP